MRLRQAGVFWNVPPIEVESRSYSHILLHPEEPLSLRVLEEMDAYADAPDPLCADSTEYNPSPKVCYYCR